MPVLCCRYSDEHREWGLLKLRGDELHQYICEIPLSQVKMLKENLVVRTSEFGVDVRDPKRIPRAPVFIKQPESAMFDLVKRDLINYVSVTCLGES